MGEEGFSAAGLKRLHEVMSEFVSAGTVPGLVLALSRGSDIVVDAIGCATPGGAAIQPDAIFRITSMTRPVTAVAALQLIGTGRLGLDEPAERLLPELAGRRVLRQLDGPVTDTVPARRPVTVRDLLTFRSGFGMILAPPEEYPILAAEAALELRSVGPPAPGSPLDPAEWLRRMGTLPLMDQPGTQWRYATSSQVLGVLVSRAAGEPLESYYAERIFEPLGMDDTAFWLPEGELGRLVPAYDTDGGTLVPADDGGQWAGPRPFADGGAGLVSTAGDYLAFGRMLLGGGALAGTRILAPEWVAAMTTDQLSPQQRDTAGPILDGRGWGFGLSVLGSPDGHGAGPRGYGWSGGYGTSWLNDPEAGLTGVLCTQLFASAGGTDLEAAFWSAVYEALVG
jgi:CubicO group peptidase (beta-lactamase class C family)